MASTTVKSIQVALTADTSSFESGMKKSSNVMRTVTRDMDKLTAEFAKGLIGPQEFATRLSRLDREIAAVHAGFNGMAAAVSRVDAIMRSLETESERTQAQLRELDQLLKIGAIDAERYAIATDRIRAAASKTAPSIKTLKSSVAEANSSMSLLDRVSMLPGVGVYAGRIQMLAVAGVGLGTAAAAITGFGMAMKSAFSTIDAAGDKAVELGINPDEFLAISYAAGSAGMAVGEIEMSLQKATVAAAEAASGNEKLQQAFGRLGITVAELNSSSPYEIMKQIGDGLANIEDPAQRAALAVDIFGKSGVKMLQVFQGGRGVLDEAMAKLKEMGISTTQRGTASVEKFQKAWNDLKTAMLGVALELWNDFGPALAEALRILADATIAAAQLVKYMSWLVGGSHEAAQAITQVGKSSADVSSGINKAQQDLIDKQVEKDNDTQQKKIDDYFSDLNEKLKALETTYARPISAQEKFMQDLKEINKLYDVGIITLQKRNNLLSSLTASQSKYNREELVKRNEEIMKRSGTIVAYLRDQLGMQMDKIGKFGRLQGPAAIERGTSAAFSQFQSNKKGTDIADKQLAIQKKMEAHLAELRRRGIVLAEATL